MRLAAPAILNNITVPLLGLCDTAIAGHLGSASYLGAISVGAMMLNVFFWLSGFLRMGTTGLTAQSLGRKREDECREVLKKSLMLAFAISILVILFRGPLLKLFLYFIQPDKEISELATLYFNIGIWGVPAQLGVMAVSGWFIGLQTTVVPMTIAISTNIINICTSILLAFVFKKGFRGIIYGTLLANWLGAIIAFVWGWKRYRLLIKHESDHCDEREGDASGDSIRKGIRWSDLFSVNSALFIRSACIMGVTMTVTAIGARLGETTLAANAVIMQFFMFFSYFMDGFAFSGEALTGKYIGESNGQMVLATAGKLCWWGVMMALFFFIFYSVAGNEVVSLLTNEREVVAEVERYKLWIILLPPVTVSAFIFDGIFVGLTRTQAMMGVTLAGAAIFFITLFGTGIRMNNQLLWASFESYLLVRGASLGVIFVTRIRKKVIKLSK